MIKKITTSIVACALLGISLAPAQAGGLLNNTSLHLLYLRSLARNASTSIDAAYYNPAGLSFGKDGWQLSLSNQSVYQERNIDVTFAPFVANGGNPNKLYQGVASAPLVPSIMAAYKADRWAFSGMLGLVGGGGKAHFNKGLGSYESIVSLVPVLGQQLGLKQYDLTSHLSGHQYVFGMQLNSSYKITDYLSASVGLRLNYVNDGYNGYIGKIRVNAPNGSMVDAPAYFSQVAQGLAAQAEQATKAGNAQLAGQLMAQAGMVKMLAGATGDRQLEVQQTGWGVTPIVGLHLRHQGLNLGLRYEFRTSLNVQNKTKVNTTGDKRFENGLDTPHDMPAILAIGASYDVLPQLTVSAGYNHFFETSARMQNDKQKHLKSGTSEYLFGAEWRAHRLFELSAGVQLTRNGTTDDYMEDMSFNNNSISVGFGTGINLTSSLKLNLAMLLTSYDDYTKVSKSYNNLPQRLQGLGLPKSIADRAAIPGKEIFTRTNKVFGIGLDYSF